MHPATFVLLLSGQAKTYRISTASFNCSGDFLETSVKIARMNPIYNNQGDFNLPGNRRTFTLEGTGKGFPNRIIFIGQDYNIVAPLS